MGIKKKLANWGPGKQVLSVIKTDRGLGVNPR